MNYLARLKLLDAGEKSPHTLKHEPTKPTEPPFDGFVGSIPGANENISIVNNETDSVTSWGWLLHFADREPLEVYCNPDATHAEILERYPDALAAEPIPERIIPADADAVAWPALTTADDDRRTCRQCANLIARRCQAAKRGEIVAGPDYEPVRDMLRRCEGYAPGADDPDTRPGLERWPELTERD